MRINNIFKLIIILSLPITLLLTTVEKVTFDIEYFNKKYSEYNISAQTGIDKKDLTRITQQLLDYLKDKRDNIIMKAKIHGKEGQVFGEREILHMVDVKKLFIEGFKIRNFTLLLSVVSIICLRIREKKELGKSFILSSSIYLSLIIILGLLMYLDFNKYFTYFHQIFFSNDLWLLDPKTDVLIQMLPLEFFYSIAYKIVTFFIIELIIILVLGIYLNKSYKNLSQRQ